MLDAPPLEPRSLRPLAAALLAGVFGVLAVLAFVLLIAFFTTGRLVVGVDGAARGVAGVLAVRLAAAYALMALGSAAVAYGLWSQRKWAWGGAVLLAVALGAASLIGLVLTESLAHAAGLVATVAIGWGLSGSRLRAWLGVAPAAAT